MFWPCSSSPSLPPKRIECAQQGHLQSARRPVLRLPREKRVEILDRVGIVAGGASTGIRVSDHAPVRACIGQRGKQLSSRGRGSATSARITCVADCHVFFQPGPGREFRPKSSEARCRSSSGWQQVWRMRQLRLRCRHGAVIYVHGARHSAAF